MRPHFAFVVAVSLALACSMPLAAGTGGGGGHSSGHDTGPYAVSRDYSGKIKRSAAARHEFQSTYPCPSTGNRSGSCPGYVIDHVVPLKRGGADVPSNMQWQTIEAARLKDKWE